MTHVLIRDAEVGDVLGTAGVRDLPPQPLRQHLRLELGRVLEVRVVVHSTALHPGHDEVPDEGDGVPGLVDGVVLREGPLQRGPHLEVRLLSVSHAQHDPGYLQEEVLLLVHVMNGVTWDSDDRPIEPLSTS